MKRLLVMVVGFVLVGSLAVLVWSRPSGSRPPSSGAERFAHQDRARLEELWPAPEFSFSNQLGQPVSKESLTGQPWVANFIFTTCRTVCPLLTTKMVRLQRELEGVPVAFVSFSVDPQNDTRQVLADYARKWNPEEKRWHLLQTEQDSLTELAAGFHITAQRTDGGVDPVMHSQVFLLVDGRGVVRGIFDLEDSQDFHQLAQAIRELSQSGPSPRRALRSGAELYHQLSCANCHENPALAPHLGGLFGQKRVLDNALTITADVAYVRESILNPEAKRLKGYPLRMPSFAGHLSPEELDGLVAYLKELPPSQPDSAPAEVATDPVCRMQVRVTPDALQAQGRYFCSSPCRDQFLKTPEKYR